MVSRRRVCAAVEIVVGVAERDSTTTALAPESRAACTCCIVSSEVATVVYRVVQEALTNVARHAEASTASVAVTVASGRLRAVVEDDGLGFDPERPVDGHLGLQGMKERAELIGGTVRVFSSPGSRTTVVLDVPLG